MHDDVLHTIANMIRFGTVAEVIGGRVTIQVGGNVTRPLRWVSVRAGNVRTWEPPSQGEQVIVLSPQGNLKAGVAIGGLNSDAFPVPDEASPDNVITLFRDGAMVLYDQAQHLLRATLPDGGKAEITAPNGIQITGDVKIVGNLKLSKNLDIDGKAHAVGDIASDADVTAGDISLTKHRTAGITLGGDVGGTPAA